MPNRAPFENMLTEIQNQASRYQDILLIFMDINHLRRANEESGRAAGDELIKAAADCMKEVFYKYGKVYRIGGDEFVVLLSKHVEDFDTLLQTFEANVDHWHGELVESMGISYGVVFNSEKKWENVEEISKTADDRMYKNKWLYYQKNGMDRRQR